MPKLIRLQPCSRMTCMEYKSGLRPLLPAPWFTYWKYKPPGWNR
jgi:hypothetical protein